MTALDKFAYMIMTNYSDRSRSEKMICLIYALIEVTENFSDYIVDNRSEKVTIKDRLNYYCYVSIMIFVHLK